jgi:asparagine synthase (glutamine-hydrolysing)
MCGIAGLIDWRAATSADALRSISEGMIETVRHRGPDAGAVWVEAEGGVALGQRRLAIIDLSPGGAQPMHSADRRYVITYNGEIYNYRDIRRELEAAGRVMHSDSDTEVLLEACALWGVEAGLERAIGMFAFALWDRKTRTLVLARDRLGIKPLYYAASPERVLFASQLKAFRADPKWQPTIDDDAVVGYLRHAYVAQPRTIYREAQKLAPGHILTLREGLTPAPKCFWDLRGIATAGLRCNDPAPDAEEAIERLDALLRDSVRLRMIADVPLGAFLSGGIDSSTVVALMQAQSTRPVKTFSIGFHEGDYNEAEAANRVAAHLGTDHTEFYVEPRHALEVIPQLPEWFDEPFADSSQIPTYLVSELTRKHVTVALSGDGGDELFAGYNRYLWAGRLAHVVRRLPPPLRGASAAALRALAPETRSWLFAFVPKSWRPALPGDKLHKLATLLDDPQPDAIYRRLVSQWERPEEIAVPGESYTERLQRAGVTVVQLDFGMAGGIASGLVRLARLIAQTKPDIVQGWMYHGDLAALIALALSGRRKRTPLIWGVRCSDMDLGRYRLGLRVTVKACTLLAAARCRHRQFCRRPQFAPAAGLPPASDGGDRQWCRY